jgi:putative transposase
MSPLHRQRKSIRLKDFDYSSPGEYFVTICTHNHNCIFGEIINEEMQFNKIGKIVAGCWKEIPEHFSNVELDEYVVMPNHVHGIIILNETVGVEYIQPLQKTYQHVIPKSLGSIVRSFKAAVTRQCRKTGNQDFHWQRGYYEHIIRNDKDLNNTRDYILNNPIKWWSDSSREIIDNINIDLIYDISRDKENPERPKI